MLAESIVGGMGVLSVAAVGAAIWQNAKQSEFFYANARIIGKASKILDKGKLLQLARAKTLSELVNQLKDTEYYPFLESIDKENMKEFNMAIEESLIQSIKDLEKISPKKFQPVFIAYTKEIESTIIKTIYRSRFSNAEMSEELLEPIGTINPILLKHLKDTKTVADMKVVLQDTKWAPVFDKEYASIEEFDVAIQKEMNIEIDDTIARLTVFDRQAIHEAFRLRRTVREILLLIKLRLRNVPKDRQKELVQIEGFDVSKAIAAENMKVFVESFDRTEWKEPLEKALAEYEKEDNYYAFERDLLSYYYHKVTGKELAHSIGPYPIISHMTKKKIERRNIFIIAKGIQSGLSDEEKERMLIQ